MTRTFRKRKLCMEKSIACWAMGGKFKQWIGIVARTLQQRKLWMGGKLKQWIGVETRTLRKRKLCIEKFYCMLGLGGKLNNELDSKQELFGRESCEWKNLLHVQLWGGKFKQWIGIMARTLQQRKLCIEKYYCMLGLGGKFKQWIGVETRSFRKRKLWMEKSIACWALGGNLNNELEARQELLSRERLESRNTFACWALGGEI